MKTECVFIDTYLQGNGRGGGVGGGQGPGADLQAYLHNLVAGGVSQGVGAAAQVGVANNMSGNVREEYIAFPQQRSQG